MWDALNTRNIPLTAPLDILLAGYVDNSDNLDSFAYLLRTFPNHHCVSISTEARRPAQILDVERGATNPTNKTAIVSWINEQQALGGFPLVYATPSNWDIIVGYFTAADMPQWWEAEWNGDKVITAGTVGHQYANSNNAVPVGAYDSSVMLDYIKGIDVTQPEPLDAGGTFNAVLGVTPVPPTNVPPSASGSPAMDYLIDTWNKVSKLVENSVPLPPSIPAEGTYTYDAATGKFTFAPIPEVVTP